MRPILGSCFISQKRDNEIITEKRNRTDVSASRAASRLQEKGFPVHIDHHTTTRTETANLDVFLLPKIALNGAVITPNGSNYDPVELTELTDREVYALYSRAYGVIHGQSTWRPWCAALRINPEPIYLDALKVRRECAALLEARYTVKFEHFSNEKNYDQANAS